METPDAQHHLERLGAELTGRGWAVKLRGDATPALHVRNPSVADLNDWISCSGEDFRWGWGQRIGPVSEVAGVADRIMFVLREVTG